MSAPAPIICGECSKPWPDVCRCDERRQPLPSCYRCHAPASHQTRDGWYVCADHYRAPDVVVPPARSELSEALADFAVGFLEGLAGWDSAPRSLDPYPPGSLYGTRCPLCGGEGCAGGCRLSPAAARARGRTSPGAGAKPQRGAKRRKR